MNGQIDGEMDRWTGGQTVMGRQRWTEGQADGQTLMGRQRDGLTEMDTQSDGLTDGQTDGQTRSMLPDDDCSQQEITVYHVASFHFAEQAGKKKGGQSVE